ncbi:unnamed protein product [Acanthoscelides obtectus]|uniref:Uncharacterized protein n=1 Tax=Acanthoscelides obtectus TaxID=200917 RepID=A0A9P0PE12_ACAOB|nr:unnamed protein product [Acanthoscelides obtectus]CAK1628618.1 hypothetical protein AOBTE_LOCUS5310 [Acanthoscelides obtectus]
MNGNSCFAKKHTVSRSVLPKSLVKTTFDSCFAKLN